MIAVRKDDPRAPHVADLIAFHRIAAQGDTPDGYRHSLDVDGLCNPAITFWTAWRDGSLAGMGALKDLGDGDGEVKSMRTAPGHLRCGIGRVILTTLITAARERRYRRILLETGTSKAFVAAAALYEAFGFVDRDAFGGYPPSAHNRFMTLAL